MRRAILTGLAMTAAMTTLAQAAEPPHCDDAAMLDKIRFQYEASEELADAPQALVDIEGIEEVHLGDPSETVNQYATATTYVETSRYCAATGTLQSGETDALYWRIDLVMDGREYSDRIEHCSDRHDIFEDNCEDMRPTADQARAAKHSADSN